MYMHNSDLIVIKPFKDKGHSPKLRTVLRTGQLEPM